MLSIFISYSSGQTTTLDGTGPGQVTSESGPVQVTSESGPGQVTSESDPGMSWTTEDAGATTESSGIGFTKLLALVVLGVVLGMLVLAVLACGCYVCIKMRERERYGRHADQVIEGHYSSKQINKDGTRTKVIAVKTNVYRDKPNTFWGVQNAVAASLDRTNPYGYDNGAFGNNYAGGSPQPGGYKPLGTGSRPTYY